MNTDVHRLTKVMVAAITVLFLMTGRASAQPCGGYEVTAIIQAPACPPFGPRPTSGYGLSEQGDVVGRYLDCANAYSQAFMWSPKTGFVILPTPPENIASVAHGIEGSRIVGTFDLSGDGLAGLAFVYDYEADEFINLGTFPKGNYSSGRAINTNMQVTGYWGNFVNGDPPGLVFLWEDGVMNDLGPAIGGVGNRAFGINEVAAITGWWREADGDEQIAFLWHDGRMTDLGPIPGGFTSQGLGINIHNQITGAGLLPEPDGPGTLTRAFLWENGQMINLGTLPGFPRSAGLGVNDDRIVVGRLWGNGQSGIIWQDGVMTDLNELISGDLDLHVFVANAINNAGQITGTASVPTGIAAVLLTPIERRLGDLDGDCAVGVSDLLMLLADWGPCGDCGGCLADLNGDCLVGVADLWILLMNWG